MFKKLITCHWFITSLIMAISALVLGLSTFKLFHLFRTNLTFIYKYGWWALEEGGLAAIYRTLWKWRHQPECVSCFQGV